MSLLIEELDAPWRQDAACIGHSDLFFTRQGQGNKVKEAKALCRTCPVMADCLDYVDSNPQRYTEFGTWAGMSTDQRRRRRMNAYRASKRGAA